MSPFPLPLVPVMVVVVLAGSAVAPAVAPVANDILMEGMGFG